MTTGGTNESWEMGKSGVSILPYLKIPGVVRGSRKELGTETLAIDGTQNPSVESYPSVHPTRQRRYISCSSGGGRGPGGGSGMRAVGEGNERYQSMLISSQPIAIVAAIKHRGDSDARFQATNARETRARETKASAMACCIPVSAASSKRSE
jgi:hypothetical protein